jgi:hypothetical protein
MARITRTITNIFGLITFMSALHHTMIPWDRYGWIISRVKGLFVDCSLQLYCLFQFCDVWCFPFESHNALRLLGLVLVLAVLPQTPNDHNKYWRNYQISRHAIPWWANGTDRLAAENARWLKPNAIKLLFLIAW